MLKGVILLKLATIGTSWITEMFIDAAKKSGCYFLHTVYSRDAEKGQLFKEKTGALYSSDNLDKMAESDIDAVYIASPNSLHFEQAKLFLRNGKHVICEKPIVTQKSQLTSLFDAAQKNGVFIFEALRHIHTPNFYAIKNSINKIAPVRSVFLSYNQYSARYDALKSGNITNVFCKEFDGGAKFDLGVYPVTLAAALFGKPVKACYTPYNLQNGVCGSGAYIFEYDGFVCSLMFSKISEDVIDNQIIGENGGLRFDQLTFDNHAAIYDKSGEATDITPPQHENQLIYEAAAFAEIINSSDLDRYEQLSKISIIANDILTTL